MPQYREATQVLAEFSLAAQENCDSVFRDEENARGLGRGEGSGSLGAEEPRKCGFSLR